MDIEVLIFGVYEPHKKKKGTKCDDNSQATWFQVDIQKDAPMVGENTISLRMYGGYSNDRTYMCYDNESHDVKQYLPPK